MTPITACEMRKIEQDAIGSGQVTGLALMERAGRGVVEAIFETWPELKASDRRASAPDRPGYLAPNENSKAVVLCGPGNNGGDGFVVARLLAERGWSVEVYLFGDAEKLPPDARVNYERWCQIGEVSPYVDKGPAAFALDPQNWGTDTLAIDALFGTGLTRAVQGFDAFGWMTQVSEWSLPAEQRSGDYPGCRVVSVDIPSGISADTGQYIRGAETPKHHEDIKAHLTVSFHRAKRGHGLADGPDACGTLVVKDIGL